MHPTVLYNELSHGLLKTLKLNASYFMLPVADTSGNAESRIDGMSGLWLGLDLQITGMSFFCSESKLSQSMCMCIAMMVMADINSTA
jgi:hypothetical protein